MDSTIAGPHKPQFRPHVVATVSNTVATLERGTQRCSFEFAERDSASVARLLAQLELGGEAASELAARCPDIAEHIPPLLAAFDDCRLLRESDPVDADQVRSGAQLFREIRRMVDRLTMQVAKSTFHTALVDGRATREQLVGYALEYYAIVQAAPGLIAPALGSAHTAAERRLLQSFLKSELGHDRFLATALQAVGVSQAQLEAHLPLTSTFALCASLGVYARQHPLSFRACLFLFERAQPAFIDAFDQRCRELDLPEAFYAPLRVHADLNDEYDHEDISRALLELEPAVDREACAVVKRHVALLVETMARQEEQILVFYDPNQASGAHT